MRSATPNTKATQSTGTPHPHDMNRTQTFHVVSTRGKGGVGCGAAAKVVKLRVEWEAGHGVMDLCLHRT